MDLSIIIVSWQAKEKLKKNLESIYGNKHNFSYEVFVVDNNSSDGSREMIENEFPQVKLIANEENLGFSKACNQAIKESMGDNILLLNPDMYLLKDTLEKSLQIAQKNQAIKESMGDNILLLNPDMYLLKDTLEKSLQIAQKNPEITVFGIKLVDEKGKVVLQARRFPKLFDQLMIVLKIHHIFPKILNNYLNKNFNYNRQAIVDSIRGSYFFINKNSWQKISQKDLPLLDERYFLWFEEVDFCRQVYENNGKVGYFPDVKAVDSVGFSFSQVNTRKKQEYFRDSMLTYFKKWHSGFSYYVLKIAWFFVISFFIFKKK